LIYHSFINKKNIAPGSGSECAAAAEILKHTEVAHAAIAVERKKMVGT
jgi:hypothetical protein